MEDGPENRTEHPESLPLHHLGTLQEQLGGKRLLAATVSPSCGVGATVGPAEPHTQMAVCNSLLQGGQES